LGGRKGIRPVKIEWWGGGTGICLLRGADLHMSQLMLLPTTVSCFSKIQIGVTFLVPAHPGSRGQRAVKWVLILFCPFFSHFVLMLFAFVVLHVVSSILNHEICLEENLKNDISCVEWDVRC